MTTTNSKYPIGIFDSGIGGISIWKEINKLLPFESTIYLSDNKNAPYGQKSREKIIELSVKNTEYLIDRGCKIIVVACNTATTNAIKHLRANYNIPFIGIEPAIKPASIQTKTGVIGILATKGTLNSSLFEKTSSKIDDNITIIEQVGEGLVELIENGEMHSTEMTKLLKVYINPMLLNKCDSIVLGCTHYPFLMPQIRSIVGPDVNIIDSGEAVAMQTKNILQKNNALYPMNDSPSNIFFSNKEEMVLQDILKEYKNITIKYSDF
ncbi:glutamate racemase [Tenacibaculum aiptasiae]|uniref:Glutamate racemase n=1 Tax=Tenacibaculum aiptasiae TaxID=426481 RepID=A0A7J5AJZ4_9FLAO|nr:glutamate racemase [Tenacibaculum aiptasiae]KAB1157319.1 glutamate racemase [Tenacibaculum aiptasiae]